MISKFKEKQEAIILRKKGLSYSEILKEIQVSKSTLSLWLRLVGLSKRQKQRLTIKKMAAMERGWLARREKRIKTTSEIKENAKNDIGIISERELWLIGIALYWAEGTKQKDYNFGQGVSFSNSDPLMIRLFLKWLLNIGVDKSELKPEIYTHDSHKERIGEIIKYWSKITDFESDVFTRIYFKRNKQNTLRRNIGKKYFGLLRIVVSKSTNINRKISGWIEGIIGNI